MLVSIPVVRRIGYMPVKRRESRLINGVGVRPVNRVPDNYIRRVSRCVI